MADTKSSGCKIIEVADWPAFQKIVRERAREEDLIWRGHADSAWKLSSPFERKLEGKVEAGKMPPDHYDELRDRYLARFKQFALGSPGCRDFTRAPDVAVWAWGRHHGLTTPLLDWSFKPYVAAFFALSEFRTAKNEKAAIFALKVERPLGAMQSGQDAKIANGLVHQFVLDVLMPPIHDLHRMRGQFGCFTQLTSVQHFDIESALVASDRSDRLTKYVLPRSCVEDAMDDLYAMGLTWATIFPDEEGAAKAANEHDLDLSQYLKPTTPSRAPKPPMPVAEPTLVQKAASNMASGSGSTAVEFVWPHRRLAKDGYVLLNHTPVGEVTLDTVWAVLNGVPSGNRAPTSEISVSPFIDLLPVPPTEPSSEPPGAPSKNKPQKK